MRLLLFNLATDADDPILGFTTRWINALAKRLDFIHVITMRMGRLELANNVQVYSTGKERGYTEVRRAGEFYRSLLRILRHDRIDVCFSHMIPIFSILAAPVLKARGIPIVTWYAHRQVTTTLKIAHHLSDCVVSINDSSYRYRHDKFLALGHGIDTNLFSPEGRDPDNPQLLLSVGRLSPIKDPITLIKAVGLLRKREHNVQCVLVGDAPERDRLYAEDVKNEAVRLGLGGVIQFVGAIPQKEVVWWYRRCFAHVNCAPSDNALDKAVLEAMACGKPSLSSASGFRRTMGQWADRLLFRPGDAEDLARKIERILQMSDSMRRAMGASLCQSVNERHSLARLGDKLIYIFQGMTG